MKNIRISEIFYEIVALSGQATSWVQTWQILPLRTYKAGIRRRAARRVT